MTVRDSEQATAQRAAGFMPAVRPPRRDQPGGSLQYFARSFRICRETEAVRLRSALAVDHAHVGRVVGRVEAGAAVDEGGQGTQLALAIARHRAIGLDEI